MHDVKRKYGSPQWIHHFSEQTFFPETLHLLHLECNMHMVTEDIGFLKD